jgi:ADP-dependent NAD(P)H-hydrate dehydratase / NAD(P)H-hydrate epimerase
MPVLSAQQIRDWDEYTIQHEPISSIALMERAAGRCFQWLYKSNYLHNDFAVFCGKGNNGGDGLALARMLSAEESKVVVYILEFGHKGTGDFQANLANLHKTKVDIKFIQSEEQLPVLNKNEVIIDALLGSGLNRPVDGFTASVVNHINNSGNEVISIDVPSGLFVDKSSKGNLVVKAKHTLAFQCQKPAFMVSENSIYIGNLHILDIGLDPAYLRTIQPLYHWVDQPFIARIHKPRNAFSHKGTHGHSLLIAGSFGKMGAAILAARACLRGGTGLLTMHIPRSGLEILQTAVPEAMCDPDPNIEVNSSINSGLEKYSVIGAGPGLGTNPPTVELLEKVFSVYPHPMVLDADALNVIAEKKLQQKIPKDSVITPHPKEFERLFGPSENDFERIEKATMHARLLQITIVLKGHYTFIADPEGQGYFNSTGNAGMATGGTGDVLTGLITSKLAQQYKPTEGAILSVFLHGAAGDLAASHINQESMIASDIVDHLGMIFLS